MTTFLILVFVVVVAGFVYLARFDGDYEVKRELVVNAPVDRVYQTVCDFKTWPEWSPWLLHEPDAKLEYSEAYQHTDGYYSWDGQMVGAGRLIHVDQHENRSLEMRIEFQRPFKSSSRVCWRFLAEGDRTRTTWSMQGRMPFLFRFLTPMMTDMIGKDYELGLHLLNGYLDPDAPHPSFEFAGITQLDAFGYLARPFKGQLEDLIETMEQGFPELIQHADDLDIASGKPCTIYFQAQPDKGYFECDLAVPVDAREQPEYLHLKRFEDLDDYYHLKVQGAYKFLPLAWYKIHSHLRMLKRKPDKSRPSLEVYENDPQSVDHSNQLLTSIYLPLK